VDTSVIAEDGREPVAPANRYRLPGLAGPALIVIAVLVVLNGFVRGLVTTGDPIRFWLPVYCHLGKSLAAGHIPAWNPAVMGGVPFAADPQSGWMYAPVMALFTALPCDVAIRAMVVLQPILAGLGIYWFTRVEGLSRPAATVGGLALALMISSGELASSLPFAASLAWTALLLAAAARYLRTRTWPARLLWAGLTAAAWGQLAAAHFSVGLVMGTGALFAYLCAAAWRGRAESGEPSPRSVAVLALMLVGVAAAINMAYLLPRLAYLPRTDLSLGYGKLDRLGAQVAGAAIGTAGIGRSVGPGWPLKLATVPGVYAGGAALLLSSAAFWRRPHRVLAVSFAVYGLVCYVVTLSFVARHVPSSIRSWRPVDMYLHNPEWFAYAVLPAVAILCGLGLEAVMRSTSVRERVAMLLPAALLWLVVPLLGAGPSRLWAVWLGAVAAAAVVAVAPGRPALWALIPVVLVVELTSNGVFGNRDPKLPFAPVPTLVQALANPSYPAADFLRSGPILDVLMRDDGGRYMKLPHPGTSEPIPPLDVEGMIPNQSVLFGTEDVGSFNPVQILRYWIFVRASQGRVIRYNRAYFVEASPIAEDLLRVAWFVAPEDRAPPADSTRVASDGVGIPWVLYQRTSTPPLAELVPSWEVTPAVDSAYPDPALSTVLGAGFDPSRVAVLERDPRIVGAPPTSARGAVSFRQLGDQAITFSADAAGPSILLVRNVFDPNWHATVDGRTVPVLRTDYLLQGVAVPPGRHDVELTYDDPSIGYGVAGSAASIATLIVAALLLRRRHRRRAA
jgi:hypothetical protein